MSNSKELAQALRQFYREMKTHNHCIAAFDFTFNNISCSCLFDTTVDPFQLVFIKRISAKSLGIPVFRGFFVKLDYTTSSFDEFCQFFEMGKSGQGFTLPPFFVKLIRSIPHELISVSDEKLSVIAKYKNVEESDKVLFWGLIDWDSPKRDGTKKIGSRTEKNLLKTKLLYPEIYDKIKNSNISVKYTSDRAKANPLPKNQLQLDELFRFLE